MAKGLHAAFTSIDAKVEAIAACRNIVASSTFASAVLTILQCDGRVIVTGIGKSGHIARKITATMISTGTEAAFLHPAEAAHGDMGMIGQADVLLMLSNSGETDELIPVMDFAEDLELPVIILTSRPDGLISKRAQMVLAYPCTREGCPVDRAPMASTVAQLALGDAIAAAVMAERGFTASDFAALHHGGYLGRTAKAKAA